MTDLTVGENYILSFDYTTRCSFYDNDFEMTLYQIEYDSYTNSSTNITTTKLASTTAIWELDATTASAQENNNTVTIEFTATATEHYYSLATSGITDATDGCFTNLPFAWVINACLNDDDIGDIYCSNYSYNLGTNCMPFVLFGSDSGINYDAANDQCQGYLLDHLWCPKSTDNFDMDMLEVMLNAEMILNDYNGAWLGVYKDNSNILNCANPLDADTGSIYFDLVDGSIPTDSYLAYVYDSDTGLGGVVGKTDSSELLQAYFCFQNFSQSIDLDKFDGSSLSDIGQMQDCISDAVAPFATISNINVKSQFGHLIEYFEDNGNETCIESLTAIMHVSADFSDEFGCEIEFTDDLGSDETEALFEVSYDIYFNYDASNNKELNYNLGNSTYFIQYADSDSGGNDWRLVLSDSRQAYASTIDDIVNGIETSISEIGFVLAHQISGLNFDMLTENMIIRYLRDDEDDYSFSMFVDSYQYSNEQVRPFYYTTNDWESLSCDGTAVYGLQNQKFDTMCRNSLIAVDSHDGTTTDGEYISNIFSVPLASFIPYYDASPSDWNIINSNSNVTVDLSADSGSTVVEVVVDSLDGIGVNGTGLFGSGSEIWVFETPIPPYIQIENDYINEITFNIPITITSMVIDANNSYSDNIFNFVVTLTDSKNYVGLRIRCSYQLICELYFIPDATSSELNTHNPRYFTSYFTSWNWTTDD